MIDPKEGKKIVFGKDIGENILTNSLKTIFCSPERKLKLLENFGKDNKIPELIVILRDDDYNSQKLYNDFKGAVGIKYY